MSRTTSPPMITTTMRVYSKETWSCSSGGDYRLEGEWTNTDINGVEEIQELQLARSGCTERSRLVTESATADFTKEFLPEQVLIEALVLTDSTTQWVSQEVGPDGKLSASYDVVAETLEETSVSEGDWHAGHYLRTTVGVSLSSDADYEGKSRPGATAAIGETSPTRRTTATGGVGPTPSTTMARVLASTKTTRCAAMLRGWKARSAACARGPTGTAPERVVAAGRRVHSPASDSPPPPSLGDS